MDIDYENLGQNTNHQITIEKLVSRKRGDCDLKISPIDYQQVTKVPEKAKKVVNYFYKTMHRKEALRFSFALLLLISY